MTCNKTNKQLMDEWPVIMREDGRRAEIICPHGVGHPVKALSNRWDDSWMGVHGCDGCCRLAICALAEMAHMNAKRIAEGRFCLCTKDSICDFHKRGGYTTKDDEVI